MLNTLCWQKSKGSKTTHALNVYFYIALQAGYELALKMKMDLRQN